MWDKVVGAGRSEGNRRSVDVLHATKLCISGNHPELVQASGINGCMSGPKFGTGSETPYQTSSSTHELKSLSAHRFQIAQSVAICMISYDPSLSADAM